MSRKHQDNLPDKKIPGAGKRHSAERINQQKGGKCRALSSSVLAGIRYRILNPADACFTSLCCTA